MALQYFDLHSDYDGLVCPMIDARRMECFTAIYSRSGTVRKTEAEIISEGCFNQWLDNQRVCFISDGAAKTKPILGVHPNAIYDCEFRISAKGMAGIAEKKLLAGETEDVAYFEPFYLKDFVAKKSVVHGLR